MFSGKIKVIDELHNIQGHKFPSNNDVLHKILLILLKLNRNFEIFIIHVIIILHYVLISYLFKIYIFTQIILNNINCIAKWLKSPIFFFWKL